MHVELTEGKFWVQKDGTQDDIAMDLMNAGIPKERIVLAFKYPSCWKDTEFAVD